MIKHLMAAAALLCASSSWAACELDREVRFAGMNWLSNMVMVDVERTIIEKGYGCKTAVETGGTLPMLTAIIRGDVDVMTEGWINSIEEVFNKGVADGKVKSLGDIYTGGVEAWWIPKYVADQNPGLKSVADLPKYKDLFQDPEEPNKGRLYTCPAGWACEVINSNLFKAFDLQDDYVLYSPGTGAALKAAISSAIKRKRNVLFYYWTPTPLVGKYDLVKLEMPAYNAEGHTCNTDPNCTKPYPGAYPAARIETAVNTGFAEQAPQLTAFLDKVQVPTDTVSKLLAWADDNGAESAEVAEHFLKNYPQLWTQWVPADVADKVKSSL
ncbi:ABC transporter substrate-binding protein [Marinobacterium arenosum]|uniref:ABC transporter substrate-binding protein n=1 Tax=Marinobacterium arenosum TaxID=2862496 RepID=UPI001C9695B8|nr:ABC transporter substrate-binding protein [Marinobacterium arenosum]MBY4677609.1 ABC transporter substrate-binding protein [Marinobacterium arenosum]